MLQKTTFPALAVKWQQIKLTIAASLQYFKGTKSYLLYFWKF